MSSSSLSRMSGIHRASALFVLIGLMFASGCSSGADTSVPVLPERIGDAGLSPSHVGEQTFSYRLTAAPLREATTRNHEPPPFRLVAARTRNARIVDRNQNVIRSAATGSTIGSIEMSPNQQKVLLYFGDAKYTIASADTLEDMASLPTRPPDFDDATGFIWRWLDDTLLIGEAHLPSIDIEGKTASEIDALPPRAILLRIYSLESAALTPVEIDATLPSIFSVREASDWSMSLLTLGEDAERVLGATIIRTPEP